MPLRPVIGGPGFYNYTPPTTATPAVIKSLQFAAKTDTATIASAVFASTGLSISVPVLAGESVRIIVSGVADTTAGGNAVQFQVTRGGTIFLNADVAGNRELSQCPFYGTQAFAPVPFGIQVVDSLPGAGTYTYQLEWAAEAVAYLNRSETDTDLAAFKRGITTMSAERFIP